MASPAMSSDEGEIVEATPLPRPGRNGSVDRKHRHLSRPSRSPEQRSRRSRSPRGLKIIRDDGDRRVDPRQFHVRYERSRSPRDGHRYRDLDRPVSRGSHGNFDARSARPRYDDLPSRPRSDELRRKRDRDLDRSRDVYSDKMARYRSRSPRSQRENGRRDRDWDYYSGSRGELNQHGTYDARPSQYESVPKQAPSVEELDARNPNAKFDQGHSAENVTTQGDTQGTNQKLKAVSRDPEADKDWDGELIDQNAAEEAEIQRRKRLREEALRRVRAAASNTLIFVDSDKAASTSSLTDQNPPGFAQETRTSSPAKSPSGIQGVPFPGALDITDDQQLVNTHIKAKTLEDGPSAADYDPMFDIQQDERRDEMRHGHGENGQADGTDMAFREIKEAKQDDDDDGFDMFAEDLDENKLITEAPHAQSTAKKDGSQANAGIVDVDDKDGYFKIRPGEVLDSCYQITATLGRGMFSSVARATEMKTNKVVAIKIMRNNDALRKGGYTEIAILQKLNAADPDNKKYIVQFQRAFEYMGHLCMAFENLSLNLREVLRKFGNNVGINLHAVRAYAYQIFIALGHMRVCNIIHADLKPDNILVNEKRNLLKICDLGTAIDRSDAATASTEITPYLVSRFYRAPEIILGMPYDYGIDMWSIGCTLYELYTGKILFTGDSNNQMLKNMQEIRGRLSAKMYRKGQLAGVHFDEQGNFFSFERDKMSGKTTVRTLPVIKPTRDLRTRLLAASSGMNDCQSRELNQFIDLLERCLALNSDKRITPGDALRHSFFVHRGVAK